LRAVKGGATHRRAGHQPRAVERPPASPHNAPPSPREAAIETAFLITCEHAGKRVPPAYRELFKGQDALLDTHRGWDPGALTLAREMARAFDAPLFHTETTRLLIDNNRSIGSPELYSEFTKPLPAAARREIVARHYTPHREPILAWVRDTLAAGKRVVHIASHSFTPELNGVVRTADVGFLYDPRRHAEAALCDRWIAALRQARPDLRLRRNYPYLGNSDGLCFRLRKLHGGEVYAGIELEVNQAFVRAGGRPWPKIRAALIESMRVAVAPLSAAPQRRGARISSGSSSGHSTAPAWVTAPR
jgi:predicted N-formylglutamate amidohydrolase